MLGRTLGVRAAAVWMAAPLLAGCGDTNLVRDAAQGVGLAGRPSEATEFVRQTRSTAPAGFMPVGVDAPARPDPRKSAADFKAMEAQLDAEKARLEAQGAQLRQAGATPPPNPRRRRAEKRRFIKTTHYNCVR